MTGLRRLVKGERLKFQPPLAPSACLASAPATEDRPC
jgi:hypothetical protein